MDVPAPTLAAELLDEIDRLLEAAISQQRAKVLALARRILPHVGPEEVLNPDGFPELAGDGPFNYEDGLLAGLIAAQMAIRAQLRRGTS